MLIAKYLEQIEKFVSLNINQSVFRGQSQDWSILPKGYRKDFYNHKNGTYDSNKSSFYHWKNEAIACYDCLKPEDEWEWLAYAQHCGLATPLLDWTNNPLVAIYFAVTSDLDKDGVLIFWIFPENIYNNYSKPPFQESKTVIFRPRPFYHRLKMQNCLLSYHPQPKFDVPTNQIFKIVIKASDKIKLREELNRLGFNRASLFGNVDSLAEHVNWVGSSHL